MELCVESGVYVMKACLSVCKSFSRLVRFNCVIPLEHDASLPCFGIFNITLTIPRKLLLQV